MSEIYCVRVRDNMYGGREMRCTGVMVFPYSLLVRVVCVGGGGVRYRVYQWASVLNTGVGW